MIYLDADELLSIAERAIGGPIEVRDFGLVEAAAARPQASWLGTDTYSSLEEKAGALIHSLVSNHGLVDGNKRLGLAGLLVFLDINGYELTWTNDQAFEFTIQIAEGKLAIVSDIAARLQSAMIPIDRLNQ